MGLKFNAHVQAASRPLSSRDTTCVNMVARWATIKISLSLFPFHRSLVLYGAMMTGGLSLAVWMDQSMSGMSFPQRERKSVSLRTVPIPVSQCLLISSLSMLLALIGL